MSNEPHEGLLGRIEGEYLEMPGLQLTGEQAQRLWGLDRETCTTILGALVNRGFLTRSDGRYARPTGDERVRLHLRPAKSTVVAQGQGKRTG